MEHFYGIEIYQKKSFIKIDGFPWLHCALKSKLKVLFPFIILISGKKKDSYGL